MFNLEHELSRIKYNKFKKYYYIQANHWFRPRVSYVFDSLLFILLKDAKDLLFYAFVTNVRSGTKLYVQIMCDKIV